MAVPCLGRGTKLHWLAGVAALFAAGWFLPPEGDAARLKDIVEIEGVRTNQLIGYGLVVGLDGTGDSSNRAGFTTQSLVMMLERMGVSARQIQDQINVKNVASVMVTAVLPPFARQGNQLDVTISSMGDAKSLEGGTLLLTPLKAPDGNVFAVAQGAVSVGGRGVEDNHLTVARIVAGATVEREVTFELNQENRLQLALKQSDFTTANRMARAINGLFGQQLATARDAGTISLQVPESYHQRVVEFVARMENLQVETDNSAKIIVNERTGTIVMGENVRISTIALSHGNLSIQVQNPPAAPNQPAPPPVENNLITMEEGITLGELVNGLNSVGASPADLIAILQAVKKAGALQADLELM